MTHPDLAVSVYPLERLTRLYDGMEQLDDDAWGDGDAQEQYHMPHHDGEAWSVRQGDSWETVPVAEDWEDFDENEYSGSEADSDEPMEIDADQWGESGSIDTSDALSDGSADALAEPITLDSGADSPQRSQKETQLNEATTSNNEEDAGKFVWKQFDILASTPPDHAFFTSQPVSPSKSFLGRISKEYRVLANSLPGTFPRSLSERVD